MEDLHSTFQTQFLSAGCNRVVNALDWGPDGSVAYGAHHMVIIYNVLEDEVRGALTGHSGNVNCVKWLPTTGAIVQGSHPILLSGSVDCTIRVWSWHPDAPAGPWSCLAVLQGHTTGVTSLAILPSPSMDRFMVVSTSSDSHLLVWQWSHDKPSHEAIEGRFDNMTIMESDGNGGTGVASGLGSITSSPSCLLLEHWHLRETLEVGRSVQHSVALTSLPDEPERVLMATGGCDSIIRLWLGHQGGHSTGPEGFQEVCRLQGHENWVRCLAFALVRGPAGTTILLASASQDRYARIWSITPSPLAPGTPSLDQQAPQEGTGLSFAAAIMRYAPQASFRTSSYQYQAVVESLLIGHEDWVHSVCWRKGQGGPLKAVSSRGDLALLTSSMDRTMVLWTYKEQHNIWMNDVSLGDAGASCLGYYGGVFSPEGDHILAHGFTGALHMWREEKGPPDAEPGPSSSALSTWSPIHAPGGHFGAVVDQCWSVGGRYLLTVSEDQTARLWGRVEGQWCEVARPQVHGHDFSCVASIPPSSCSDQYRYASGSEEKVIRVFEAPLVFLETLRVIEEDGQSAEAATTTATAATDKELQPSRNRRAYGAAVGALGLSNKAVYEDDTKSGGDHLSGGYADGPDFVPCSVPSVVSGRPLEEHLAQNTLWPEVQKLYGHGNDVFCLAASPCGQYVASAARSQTANAAAIWVWETESWRAVAQLTGHTLTVTQLAFSPSGQYLMSGSRDRTFAIFSMSMQRVCNGQQTDASNIDHFRLIKRVRGAHSRIIWGVTWSWDEQLVATGSRDQSVKLWRVLEGTPEERPAHVLPSFDSPVTCVQFTPWEERPRRACWPHESLNRESSGHVCLNGQLVYRLAVGLESGGVQLWRVEARDHPEGVPWTSSCTGVLSPYFSHAAAVRRLSWSTLSDRTVNEGVKVMLATCSNDHTVRLHDVSWDDGPDE